MGIAFVEDTVTTVAKLNGVIKQNILASSDWTHLAVAAGSTIATSTVAAGATTCTVASGAPFAIGRTITFWRNSSVNGAATPECRVLSNVSGTTLTWVDALTAPNGTYQVGDAVGVGTYCKATTTRGAQMVVDLEGATITAQRMQLTVYRTHDGTTGVDSLTRYIYWKNAAGATTDTVRATVSAGKEHLYFSVEGPRAGETNATSSVLGSEKQFLAISDISPYYSTTYDNTPAVALIANTTASVLGPGVGLLGSRQIQVSRDAPNASSWVVAALETVGAIGGDNAGGVWPRTYNPIGLDGNLVTFPFLVIEDAKGLRGWLSRFYYGGGSPQTTTFSSDPTFFTYGMETTQSGVTYRSVQPLVTSLSVNSRQSWGWPGDFAAYSGQKNGPVIFIPKV